MGMHTRYQGEFLSRAGVRWRVEILQRAESPFAQIEELTFAGDAPLEIEWSHSGKEETICGSAATLRIISPGDRTYTDLYTEQPGSIRMDVYREGQLYWSGGLDPEFYEEPYERARDYTVELSFSDFGALDRLDFNLNGNLSLLRYIENSIDRCGINTVLDSSLISSSLPGDNVPLSLNAVSVRSANFYDEDGEPSSLKDVVESLLKPLALRMEQRCGRTYIYDLNALYMEAHRVAAIWDGDSQTLGTDKVYNKVKITWSPYADAEIPAPEECWTEPVDSDETWFSVLVGSNIEDKWKEHTSGKEVGDCEIWSYPQSDKVESVLDDPTDVSFTLWTSRNRLNHWHYREREKSNDREVRSLRAENDSLRTARNRVDSIPYQVEVEKTVTVERRRSWWETALLWAGGVALIWLIGSLIYKVRLNKLLKSKHT